MTNSGLERVERMLVAGVVLVLSCFALGVSSAWAAPADCPGITTAGGQTGIPLLGESIACAGSVCPSGAGSFVEDVIIQLCNLGVAPAACGKCQCCKEPTTELVTGTELAYVGGNPNTSCHLGGRGKPMGEAALCLLRDLAKPALSPSLGGSGIHLSKSFSVAIGNASLDQHVGFIDFDLPGREMRGYHSLSFCLPVLGCVNNQTQSFTARLVRSTDGTAACTSYRFEHPWLLVVDSDDTEHNLTLEVGPFVVYTPAGPVKVTPRLDYETNLEAVGSPWTDNNQRTSRLPDCAVANLVDVTNANGAVLASFVAGSTSQAGSGWDSILGLGGRDPNPESPQWGPPAGDFPPRPDFDFSIARNTDEKRPANRFRAAVKVSYGLDALGVKLSFPPFSLDDASVFVTSALDGAASSQFQIAFDEQRYKTIPPDCKPDPFTAVELQSALAAFAELKVEAGLRIAFSIDLGFYTKHFKINKTAPIIESPSPDTSPMLGPVARADMFVSAPPTPAQAYSQLVSFSGGGENGLAFVNACLTEPPPADQPPPPPPQFTPGDPRDLLEPLEFPCNICLFLPSSIFSACVPKQTLVNAGTIASDYDCGLGLNGGPCPDPNCETVPVTPPVAVNLTEVVFPVSQQSLPADQQWLCNQTEKSGCFDLCNYDPEALQPLVVTQSAVTKFGTVCRDGVPGGSSGTLQGTPCTGHAICDDGNPCTTGNCVLQGEFGTCQLTANEASCDDGAFCNGADTCALGVCSVHAGNPCNAGNCCNEALNTCPASCPTTPCDGKNEGNPCDDGTSCSGDEQCIDSIAGLLCRGEPAITCTDADICTATLCEEIDGEPQCMTVMSGACPPNCGDGILDTDEECDAAADAACPGECEPDCRCPPPLQRTGDPCMDPSQCASGFCVDGMCCDSACDQEMEQCNLPDKPGICTPNPIPAPTLSPPALVIAFAALAAVAAWSLARQRRDRAKMTRSVGGRMGRLLNPTT